MHRGCAGWRPEDVCPPRAPVRRSRAATWRRSQCQRRWGERCGGEGQRLWLPFPFPGFRPGNGTVRLLPQAPGRLLHFCGALRGWAPAKASGKASLAEGERRCWGGRGPGEPGSSGWGVGIPGGGGCPGAPGRSPGGLSPSCCGARERGGASPVPGFPHPPTFTCWPAPCVLSWGRSLLLTRHSGPYLGGCLRSHLLARPSRLYLGGKVTSWLFTPILTCVVNSPAGLCISSLPAGGEVTC